VRFGTDGVRGVANVGLTPETALAVGRAVGGWLAGQGLPMRAVVGEDTRRSSPMLSSALAAGLASVGADCELLGVVPTGAVGWAVRHGGYGTGLVVSASHNPAADNGIKLFDPDGAKASRAFESFVERGVAEGGGPRPAGAAVGQVRPGVGQMEAYSDWLCGLVPEGLAGMRIALDTANGAAWSVAPQVLRRLGADLVVAAAEPDGTNINAGCGATSPERLQRLTAESGADLGVAFDGDADRAVFCDSSGRLVNGDRTMAIWAEHWAGTDRFEPKVIVGTVMTNGGFEAEMRAIGVAVERVDVGDKHVSARLKELGGKIGGEQSGHIVFPEHAPTGDGLVTALELLRVVRRSGRPLAELFACYEAWPQVLVNIEVPDAATVAASPGVEEARSSACALVAGRGRVNVRPSGTQPMLRVMVEADDRTARDEAAAILVKAVRDGHGGRVVAEVDLTHALGD
jgi:phosphoglucosamine mutase